jgi:3-hydroxyacyl-CoA dehydrogenase/enoyl-CoA hydratase/3-hydroxybutyryl-CoA epimerase
VKTIRYDVDADRVVTLTFDDPDARVNTMSPQWKRDISEAIDRLAAERDALRGVIIASAKPAFLAGADLKVVQNHRPEDMPRVFAETEALKRQFRRLETLGKPVVACIAGAALGGGFEIALCAHHRIAVDDPKVQLGLPEATLGLLPAAGGVTKMVRHLGLLKALPILLDGRPMTPVEAAQLGLVELVPRAEDLRGEALAWIQDNPAPRQPWDRPGYEIPHGGVRAPDVVQGLHLLPAAYEARAGGPTPAMREIMACAVRGARVDVDTALRLETRAIVKLFTDPTTKRLIAEFFERVQARRAERAAAAGAS